MPHKRKTHSQSERISGLARVLRQLHRCRPGETWPCWHGGDISTAR